MTRRVRARIRLASGGVAVKVDGEHAAWAIGELRAAKPAIEVVLRGFGLQAVEGAVLELEAPRTCAACGQGAPVLVAMEPGGDRAPWALCRRCWA